MFDLNSYRLITVDGCQLHIRCVGHVEVPIEIHWPDAWKDTGCREGTIYQYFNVDWLWYTFIEFNKEAENVHFSIISNTKKKKKKKKKKMKKKKKNFQNIVLIKDYVGNALRFILNYLSCPSAFTIFLAKIKDYFKYQCLF